MPVMDATLHPDRADMLVSATIFLMSAYMRQGASARLASMILRHLELIADRCDISPALSATCAQLTDHWGAELQRVQKKPTPT